MEISEKQAIKICKKLNKNFIKLKFLGKGNHNENYILKTDSEKLVLRIENNHQFKNLKNEYKFLKKLNGKFGPKVYLFDNSHKIISKDYLIEEFIKGVHPTRKVGNKFIELMAQWYKKLHTNKKLLSIKEKKKHNLLYQLKKYEKNMKKYNNLVPIKLWKDCEETLKKAELLFNKYKNIIDNRKYLSLVQGDPTRSNVFYNKKHVKLIDWEFVKYAHAETDLVFFFYAYDLTNKQMRLFLENYNYPNSKFAKIRLDLFFINHHIGMINWRFERLYLSSIGKANYEKHAPTKKEMINRIKENLLKINHLFLQPY